MSTAASNLVGAIHGAQATHTEATAALTQIEGAFQQAQQAFASAGGNDKLALLGAIDEKLRLARGATQEAATALEEMSRLAVAVAEGQAGLMPSAGGGMIVHPAARTTDPSSSFDRSVPPALTPSQDRQQFFAAALTPAKLAEIFASLPAKASAGDGKPTSGVWIDNQGNQRPVSSGSRDIGYEVAHQFWMTLTANNNDVHWGSRLDTNTHAEIKAVVQMYADQRQHGTVVINHPDGPCGGRPFACQQLMQRYLRQGQTLSIYWPNGNLIIKGQA